MNNYVGKQFTQRRELRKQCPRWSTWQSFHFNVCLRSKNWDFKNTLLYPTFWKYQKLLSPEGNAKQTLGVQLIFLWVIVIHEGKIEFQFCNGNPPKNFGQKPLSPEGNAKQTLGVQLIFLWFIPRRECEADPRGPIDFLMVYCHPWTKTEVSILHW